MYWPGVEVDSCLKVPNGHVNRHLYDVRSFTYPVGQVALQVLSTVFKYWEFKHVATQVLEFTLSMNYPFEQISDIGSTHIFVIESLN